MLHNTDEKFTKKPFSSHLSTLTNAILFSNPLFSHNVITFIIFSLQLYVLTAAIFQNEHKVYCGVIWEFQVVCLKFYYFNLFY